MAAQHQQPPKQQLVQGLPGMFPDKSPAWRALAALAIGQLHDDVAAGLVSFGAEDKRATIEAAVAGTAGAAGRAAAGPAAAGAAGVVSAAVQQIVDAIDERLEPFKRLVVAAYNNQHWAPASSTSTVRQRFRHEAFTAYGAFNDTKTETWCVVTGMWWPTWAAQSVPYVRKAHIMGRSTPESDWVDMQLGRSRDVLENVVPMMASVEAAFETQRMCVLPTKDDETGAVSFVVHILDPALKDQLLYQDFTGRFKRQHVEWTPPLLRPQERVGLGEVKAGTLTFGQLHMQPLVFLGEQRPAKRCFTSHAFWALGLAKRQGWDAGGLEITADHFGWQSPTMEAQMRETAVWTAMLQQQPQQEADSG